MAKPGKPGKYRDAANTSRSGEVAAYFKYYDKQLGGWVFHLLGEDLTLVLKDNGDYRCWYEDAPYSGRGRGRPRGPRYDDTHILKVMAQISKMSGEARPRRLAILALSQMKLKHDATRESVIKRLAARYKDFYQK